MANQFIYMPVLRVRQEETKILERFDFGKRIYPCLEIVKELAREGSRKNFEQFHIDLVRQIKSDFVFIDIPIHFKTASNTEAAVKSFMLEARTMELRTKRILSLAKQSKKIIPVISSYFSINHIKGTLRTQAADLRPVFNRLAFRVNRKRLLADIGGVEILAKQQDYLIIDFSEDIIDLDDADTRDVVEAIGSFKACPVIVLRSAVPASLPYKNLVHDAHVTQVDNSLPSIFREMNADGFGDYAGVRKDAITSGGTDKFIPGLLFFEATSNSFTGFRGERMGFGEYERIIVPAVMASASRRLMDRAARDFLSDQNAGWELLELMHRRIEKTKSPAKFKRITIEHYLHCMKILIEAGDWD